MRLVKSCRNYAKLQQPIIYKIKNLDIALRAINAFLKIAKINWRVFRTWKIDQIIYKTGK